ncbi:MAG: WYL domain-containing transcriptional regulator [Ruminococcaceae bacterium]|nr:WYL domain-containing transcriptional regulator [Oscillospiraceae bacterium]
MKNEKLNKIRLLKIWEMLQAETDEDHPMGTEEIIARLSECGIDSHRTTIYDDIKLLNECGYEILSRRGRSNKYYVEDRSFSSAELHILLDAIQAASFITDKKTKELVDKIANLAGSQKGLVLKRNIVQFNTTKSSNESIYYSVNEIVTAINNRQKIIFYYFDYDTNHKRVYRHNKHHYVVSPYATVFSDGHYYLVTYDDRYNKMVNYRIDRMEQVQMVEDHAVMPPDELAFDIATHKKQLFGMFSGEATEVTIEMNRSLIDAVYDLFGEKTRILALGDDTIRFTAEVQVSPLFFGWCCSFGERLKVVGPYSVIDQLKEYTETIQKQYSGDNDE